MNVLLAIAGILGGIAIFLAARYLASDILLLDRRSRAMYALSFVLTLAVVASLANDESERAGLLAVLLFFATARTVTIAPRWYRAFLLLAMLFALVVMMRYVALN